jgi:hypothetical protein
MKAMAQMLFGAYSIGCEWGGNCERPKVPWTIRSLCEEADCDSKVKDRCDECERLATPEVIWECPAAQATDTTAEGELWTRGWTHGTNSACLRSWNRGRPREMEKWRMDVDLGI